MYSSINRKEEKERERESKKMWKEKREKKTYLKVGCRALRISTFFFTASFCFVNKLTHPTHFSRKTGDLTLKTQAKNTGQEFDTQISVAAIDCSFLHDQNKGNNT